MPSIKPRLVHGSLQEGLDKLAKMPPVLRTRIEMARCFLNLNAIWDYYQARGIAATLRQVAEDERNALLDRFTDDKQVYQCGHTHETFGEAQRCPRWLLVAAGSAPSAQRH